MSAEIVAAFCAGALAIIGGAIPWAMSIQSKLSALIETVGILKEKIDKLPTVQLCEARLVKIEELARRLERLEDER